MEIVRADSTIQVIDDLSLCSDGNAEFRCSVAVGPFPNVARLPERVRLRVQLDSTFPYHGVDIYPEDESVRGFPHQDAETHKLCLFPDRQAFFNASRLKQYIDWAREWLIDAATEKLLPLGDPYEIPDFSRRDFQGELPTELPLLFDETDDSFGAWHDRMGATGYVDLLNAKILRGLLVSRFIDEEKNIVREWTYPKHLAERRDRVSGRWLLLSDPAYTRHRPPQTFGELTEMCIRLGVDLQRNIRLAREQRNRVPEAAFVLVGFQIPHRVGDEVSEVHWQPIYLSNNQTDRRERRKQKNHKSSKFKDSGLWNALVNEGGLAPQAALPWARSENIARKRLYARGEHSNIAAYERVVLAGCGALGGILAEMIIRGGAQDVHLLDKDLFELGNQCRHTLDGGSLRRGKATALSDRLQSCNPMSNITGYLTCLPPRLSDQNRDQIAKVINDADLIIDCTTDEGAFRWLDKISSRNRTKMVSMFVNFRATILTLAVSGRSSSCSRICQRLYLDIHSGVVPVTELEHGGQPNPDELVLPGPGCWHPTFPATNADMWLMTAAATNALNQLLGEPPKVDGTAMLFRRNIDAYSNPIEVVWKSNYR